MEESLLMAHAVCALSDLHHHCTDCPVPGNLPGLHDIPAVFGPIGRTVEDIELACRVAFALESDNYDPAPIPYRDVTLPEKLKFGYYVSGQLLTTAAMFSIMTMAVASRWLDKGIPCR